MKNQSEMFKTKEGPSVNVHISDETAWLNQNQMSDRFGKDRTVISRHINNVFKEGELDKSSVCANFALTAADGKLYQVDHFNLDVITSVGYRVKSKRGTQCRIWANKVLNDYRYIPDGKKRIEDNGLVARSLLIAHSNPEDKDTFIKLIINLINKRNN